MASESRNKNILANILILLVALFIAFNFIYKKQEKQLADLKAQKELEAKKNAVLENIVKLTEKVDAYKKLFPKKDASVAINTISDIARQQGLKIISIRPPSSEQQTPDYTKSSFDVSLGASSYHALGKFIARLESYQDVFIVDSISLSSQEPKKELNVNLKVSTIAAVGK